MSFSRKNTHLVNEDFAGEQKSYEQMFSLYPDYMHRFLGAAYRKVRNNVEDKLLEFNDPAGFKRKVAFAAFQMQKLSKNDLQGSDPYSPLGVKESLTEMHTFLSMPPSFYHQEAKEPVKKALEVRIYKIENHENPVSYVVRLNGVTMSNFNIEELENWLMLDSGMSPQNVVDMLDEVKKTGSCAYTIPKG